ncbi:MAG: dTDP-4-dehydrorhamnose 3,5-epimerase family protein [Deltaproteobacteria bacterium]|nr:dTDP-4-dehydrorhamnose 3,5-epimerase family protein [Deltaproteobacteria bacterium]
MIEGVVLKELVTHADDRGFFREIIRATDGSFVESFGQWSHSLMFDGVIKAWHYHRIQTDWWYVATGVLRVGLYDLREDSPTFKETMDFYMGDLQPAKVIKIPPGIAHGCKTIQGPVNLFYFTSHVYNPADEIRLPYDDPQIDFDWTARPTTK